MRKNDNIYHSQGFNVSHIKWKKGKKEKVWNVSSQKQWNKFKTKEEKICNIELCLAFSFLNVS